MGQFIVKRIAIQFLLDLIFDLGEWALGKWYNALCEWDEWWYAKSKHAKD